MIEVQLETGAASAALERAEDLLTDLTPLMIRLGDYLAEATIERFPTGRAPDGSAWAPKSLVTLERQGGGQRGADPRPLFGPSGLLSRLISYEVTPTSVTVGSNMIYAAVQQFGAAQGAFGVTAAGGPIPWGNIPARPFLGLSDDDERAVVKIVEKAIGGALDT